ncbi:MAG: sulfotransferase [Spirochaetales bacterium]|nr:sulfotransferase [Spirochaetales bacterium]
MQEYTLPFFESHHLLRTLAVQFCNGFSSKKVSSPMGVTSRPIFIVGSGRSGNTLLRRILMQGKQVIIPPETYVLGEFFDKFIRYNYIKYKDLVYLCYSLIEYHPEFDTFSLPGLGELVHEQQKSHHSLSELIEGFFLYYASKHDSAGLRWGDKTPLNAFAIFRLATLFPQAQFIHMIRNPVDVTSSYLDAKLYSNLESATNRWLMAVSHIRRFQKKFPDSIYEVFYEELVTKPHECVEKISNFLGLEYCATMLKSDESLSMGDVKKHDHHSSVMKPITAGQIGKGYQKLTAKECHQIQDQIVCNATIDMVDLLQHYHFL